MPCRKKLLKTNITKHKIQILKFILQSDYLTSRQPDNLDDIIAIAIEAEFPPDRSKLPSDRSLNDRESNRMMELFLASRALEEPLEVGYFYLCLLQSEKVNSDIWGGTLILLVLLFHEDK